MFEIEEPVVYFKSSEKMEEVANNSVQLIITSPPYGKIKDYGSKQQIGFSDSFEEYFERLKNVWKECLRILEPQCRMVINIGDQYLRTSEYGRYRILSIASRIIKDCLELGFDFLGDIIWQKISTTNTTGGCSLMGSIFYPRNGLLTFDYEHILIFKKVGKQGLRKIEKEVKELSKISLSEWKKWYIGHWRFPGIVQKEHIAMFPEELPYRLIRMFSFIGDTILDPFVGSGTTLKVAKSLFRKSIGYEINNYYQDIINKKIQEARKELYQDYQFLLYNIFKKTNREGIEICFEKQKQKGIIILRNEKRDEIILDYFLIDRESNSKENLRNEINSKLEENTIDYYMKEKEDWKLYKNYVLIINSKLPDNIKPEKLMAQIIKSKAYNKKIQLITFKNSVSKGFLFSNLFE
ncbi:MAG: DNA-methyltransferase [Promethearchaeota archaeon]